MFNVDTNKKVYLKEEFCNIIISQTMEQAILNNHMLIVVMKYVVMHRKTPVLKEQLGPVKALVHYLVLIPVMQGPSLNDHHRQHFLQREER